MANPTIFSYSLLDRLNLRAETPLYVAYDGATETVDALIGSWLATGALLDATTSSQITGGSVTIPLEPNGSWKTAPASSGNKNNEVLILNFENAANRYVQEVPIPAYLDTFVVNGKVNLAATALDALIDNIVATGGTTFYQWIGFEQLTAVRNAFLTTRKRNGQTSKTRTIG